MIRAQTGGKVATFRFAPSPNGELHVGHALSALTGWHWARRCGGRFLVRIEDIDSGRARQAFIDQIFDDLQWLGIDWDGPVLRQSERFDTYLAQANRLRAMGLIYPCFATRREIADAAAEIANHPADPDGAPLYPKLHKGLTAQTIAARQAAGEVAAWRLDMAGAIDTARAIIGGDPITYTAVDGQGRERTVIAQPARWGDAVIVRRDVPASYHLAVVSDDATQGVSHVTRGRDLEASTDIHRLLQVLLGLPAPVYHHHRLILDEAGAKLAKRLGSVSLRALRAQGLTPDEVRAMVGRIEVPEA